MSTFFLEYWYYNIPNYILAALIYTVLGRAVLGMFVPDQWPNYIWKAFRNITNPVMYAAHLITPSAVPAAFLPFVTVVWLVLIRVGFTLMMVDLGLTPPVVVPAG